MKKKKSYRINFFVSISFVRFPAWYVVFLSVPKNFYSDNVKSTLILSQWSIFLVLDYLLSLSDCQSKVGCLKESFSVAKKTEIIKNPKFSKVLDLTKLFIIAYSMLQTIVKQKVSGELKSEKLGNLSQKRKTLKTSPYKELEKTLYQLFKQGHAF